MSIIAFCQWEAVRERVASGLHLTAATLAAEWDALCSQGTKDAASELRRIFILKGYAPSLLSQWDDRAVYNEMLGAFFAFVRGTALATYDLKSVEYLDIRKELKEAAALVIGGEAVAPGNTDIGGINYGTIDAVDDAKCRYEGL